MSAHPVVAEFVLQRVVEMTSECSSRCGRVRAAWDNNCVVEAGFGAAVNQ